MLVAERMFSGSPGPSVLRLVVHFCRRKFVVIVPPSATFKDLKKEILRVYAGIAASPSNTNVPIIAELQDGYGCVLFDEYSVGSVLRDLFEVYALTAEERERAQGSCAPPGLGTTPGASPQKSLSPWSCGSGLVFPYPGQWPFAGYTPPALPFASPFMTSPGTVQANATPSSVSVGSSPLAVPIQTPANNLQTPTIFQLSRDTHLPPSHGSAACGDGVSAQRGLVAVVQNLQHVLEASSPRGSVAAMQNQERSSAISHSRAHVQSSAIGNSGPSLQRNNGLPATHHPLTTAAGTFTSTTPIDVRASSSGTVDTSLLVTQQARDSSQPVLRTAEESSGQQTEGSLTCKTPSRQLSVAIEGVSEPVVRQSSSFAVDALTHQKVTCLTKQPDSGHPLSENLQTSASGAGDSQNGDRPGTIDSGQPQSEVRTLEFSDSNSSSDSSSDSEMEVDPRTEQDSRKTSSKPTCSPTDSSSQNATNKSQATTLAETHESEENTRELGALEQSSSKPSSEGIAGAVTTTKPNVTALSDSGSDSESDEEETTHTASAVHNRENSCEESDNRAVRARSRSRNVRSASVLSGIKTRLQLQGDTWKEAKGNSPKKREVLKSKMKRKSPVGDKQESSAKADRTTKSPVDISLVAEEAGSILQLEEQDVTQEENVTFVPMERELDYQLQPLPSHVREDEGSLAQMQTTGSILPHSAHQSVTNTATLANAHLTKSSDKKRTRSPDSSEWSSSDDDSSNRPLPKKRQKLSQKVENTAPMPSAPTQEAVSQDTLSTSRKRKARSKPASKNQSTKPSASLQKGKSNHDTVISKTDTISRKRDNKTKALETKLSVVSRRGRAPATKAPTPSTSRTIVNKTATGSNHIATSIKATPSQIAAAELSDSTEWTSSDEEDVSTNITAASKKQLQSHSGSKEDPKPSHSQNFLSSSDTNTKGVAATKKAKQSRAGSKKDEKPSHSHSKTASSKKGAQQIEIRNPSKQATRKALSRKTMGKPAVVADKTITDDSSETSSESDEDEQADPIVQQPRGDEANAAAGSASATSKDPRGSKKQVSQSKKTASGPKPDPSKAQPPTGPVRVRVSTPQTVDLSSSSDSDSSSSDEDVQSGKEDRPKSKDSDTQKETHRVATSQPSKETHRGATSQLSKETHKGATSQPSKETHRGATSQPSKETHRGATSQPSKETHRGATSQPSKETHKGATSQPSKETHRGATSQPSKETHRGATSQPSKETHRGATSQPSKETHKRATSQPSKETHRGATSQPSKESHSDTDSSDSSESESDDSLKDQIPPSAATGVSVGSNKTGKDASLATTNSQNKQEPSDAHGETTSELISDKISASQVVVPYIGEEITILSRPINQQEDTSKVHSVDSHSKDVSECSRGGVSRGGGIKKPQPSEPTERGVASSEPTEDSDESSSEEDGPQGDSIPTGSHTNLEKSSEGGGLANKSVPSENVDSVANPHSSQPLTSTDNRRSDDEKALSLPEPQGSSNGNRALSSPHHPVSKEGGEHSNMSEVLAPETQELEDEKEDEDEAEDIAVVPETQPMEIDCSQGENSVLSGDEFNIMDVVQETHENGEEPDSQRAESPEVPILGLHSKKGYKSLHQQTKGPVDEQREDETKVEEVSDLTTPLVDQGEMYIVTDVREEKRGVESKATARKSKLKSTHISVLDGSEEVQLGDKWLKNRRSKRSRGQTARQGHGKGDESTQGRTKVERLVRLYSAFKGTASESVSLGKSGKKSEENPSSDVAASDSKSRSKNDRKKSKAKPKKSRKNAKHDKGMNKSDAIRVEENVITINGIESSRDLALSNKIEACIEQSQSDGTRPIASSCKLDANESLAKKRERIMVSSSSDSDSTSRKSLSLNKKKPAASQLTVKPSTVSMHHGNLQNKKQKRPIGSFEKTASKRAGFSSDSDSGTFKSSSKKLSAPLKSTASETPKLHVDAPEVPPSSQRAKSGHLLRPQIRKQVTISAGSPRTQTTTSAVSLKIQSTTGVRPGTQASTAAAVSLKTGAVAGTGSLKVTHQPRPTIKQVSTTESSDSSSTSEDEEKPGTNKSLHTPQQRRSSSSFASLLDDGRRKKDPLIYSSGAHKASTLLSHHHSSSSANRRRFSSEASMKLFSLTPTIHPLKRKRPAGSVVTASHRRKKHKSGERKAEELNLSTLSQEEVEYSRAASQKLSELLDDELLWDTKK